jgi:lipopolysaccharide assembly outer membrane protein LptD (OstA)
MQQRYRLFLLFLLMFPAIMQAQSQLEVIRADSLNGIQQDLIMRKTLIGHVQLRQGTTLLSCDQAVLNSTTNNVEAYGHVRIIQADTVTIHGDTAIYNGDSRQAFMSGRVKLDDHTIVMSTNKLDYDLNSRMAIYHTGAKIIDKKSTLTSREGFYNTVTKNFLFKEKVVVLDKDGSAVRGD